VGRKIVDVHEGVDRHGGYILSACGRTFRAFEEFVAAFPLSEYVIIFHPKQAHQTIVDGVHFDVFDPKKG
jgi:hypothetical protein